MRLGEYVLMTAAAAGVQITCDWNGLVSVSSPTYQAKDWPGLTMSHPSLALAMAEKYGAPV